VVSPIALNGLPDDLAELETHFRAHEAVLEHVLVNTTVLPMRFGTIVASRAQVIALLGHRQGDLLSALQRLEGKVEWGLNVTWDASAAREHVEADSRSLVDAGPASRPGAAYLRSQRQKKATGDEVEQARLRLAAALHDRVADLAADAIVQPLRDHRGGLLRASYLVQRSGEDAFRTGVARQLDLVDAGTTFGLAADLSGPWPPYNFVGSLA
jgi:hypothetical protein